jgi:uncharacterized membrane protein
MAAAPARRPTSTRSRSLRVGAMLGVAAMAAVDTIDFHQLLGWHHFYDRSTPDIGLLSDGLLQTAYLALLVGGLFAFADLRRRRSVARRSAWAGLLLGAGGFQLFDGIVDHKVLRLHQVRRGVDDLLVHDLAWNVAAVVLLVLGLALARSSRDEGRPDHPLVLGMWAPVALVLGAPVTLTLSTLHLSPLYALSTRSEAVHHLLHVHVLLAGCLFAWSVAGPDPAPRRPTSRCWSPSSAPGTAAADGLSTGRLPGAGSDPAG